jgi:hypothetical protein
VVAASKGATNEPDHPGYPARQGVGKDSLLEPAKYGVGPWNFAEVSPQQVLGRFCSQPWPHLRRQWHDDMARLALMLDIER